ncbi:hypothetical protein TSUD_381290 [Trifolium subterraneum]|uniref:Uncharacterized protein n=1 Tax=Trifolium subterraneum TaxID=3900 RepID=A0A2Z6MNY8_TRISU|nr:hypothetical protein TSUD_381290 [Trifolium subterraneum]
MGVYDYVADIVIGKENVPIKVRVLRLWRVHVFLNLSEFSSIEMVLVDEKVSFSYCHLEAELVPQVAPIVPAEAVVPHIGDVVEDNNLEAVEGNNLDAELVPQVTPIVHAEACVVMPSTAVIITVVSFPQSAVVLSKSTHGATKRRVKYSYGYKITGLTSY